jgi:hypothetical protein
MLSRRSLLGSLVKSLLAAGVIAVPSAAIVVPSAAEAQPTPSPSPGEGVALHRGGARVNIIGARWRKGVGSAAPRGVRGGSHAEPALDRGMTHDIAGATYNPQAPAF